MLAALLKSASAAKKIEFIASTQKSNTVSGDDVLVIDKPIGVAEGDLMVAAMQNSDGKNRTWTGDSGWTEVVDPNSQPNLRIAYKLATASEPGSYTFTCNNNGGIVSGAIVAYSGAVFETVGSVASMAAAGTISAPSITAAENNSLLIAAFASAEAFDIAAPAGMTARSSSASSPSFVIADESIDAGATGSRSTLCGATSAGVLIAIKRS